jgi:arsenate reductase
MAEGFARHFGGSKVIAESAGVEKSEIHPLTVQVMKEIGIDISQQTSKTIDMQKFMKANTVVKMCEQIKERCPVVPFGIQNIQMDIPDPSPKDGSLGNIEDFRQTRDLIKDKVLELLRSKNLL